MIAEKSFLVEYVGELISEAEGVKREITYQLQNKGCFLYFFSHQQRQLWYVNFALNVSCLIYGALFNQNKAVLLSYNISHAANIINVLGSPVFQTFPII